MNARLAVVLLSLPLVIALAQRAQGQADLALTGIVTSAEEGAMEGVMVSARKNGSTQTITVVSDREGRYRFPPAKLEPGPYALAIRAIGYEIAGDKGVSIAAGRTTTADVK